MIKNLLRAIIPNPVLTFIQSVKRNKSEAPVRKMNKWGVEFRLKNDPYSPLPVLEDSKKNKERWNKPSAFKGIDYDIPDMESKLAKMILENAGLKNFISEKELDYGVGYTQTDAVVLYCMLVQNKPTRYYELGSGSSTYITDYTRRKDRLNIKIKTVDPEPFKKLYELENIEIIKDEAQNIPIDFFDDLEENDILFIDTTHIVKVDGEVNYLILEILPRLKKGVLIHFHDIPFPYNIPYPADYWIINRSFPTLEHYQVPMYWTEPMLLQAFLAFNDSFKIEMSLPLLRFHDEDFLKKIIPGYETVKENPNTFSSLWIRKIK